MQAKLNARYKQTEQNKEEEVKEEKAFSVMQKKAEKYATAAFNNK